MPGVKIEKERKLKEVLLHIGMHKTGSSSIQASLKNYSDDTTTCASFREENHSRAITTIFSSNRYKYHVWQRMGLTNKEIDRKRKRYLKILEKDIKNPKFQRLLISAETISTLPNADKRSLLDFFTTRGCKVKVVCFLRSPSDYVKSMVQQRIKGGWGELAYVNPYYGKRLRVFSSLLSADQLIVRDFSETIKEYGDIVLGFASICGLDSDRIEPIRVNESLSATATKFLYLLNTLDVAIYGSKSRYEAKSRLNKTLRLAFPATGGDKIDSAILAGLLKPDMDDQLEFISDTFQIDYRDDVKPSNLEACEAYLSDFSSLDEQALFDVLQENAVEVDSGVSVDEMLVALFNKFLSEI